MTGLLREDGSAAVADPAEASAVYGRGFFGTPQSGGGLDLDRYETVYLTEMHRLGVVGAGGRSTSWATAFRRASRADAEFGVRYLVYRDLRQRGYVVRASGPPVQFAVLPRGGVLHKTPARFWVEPMSERAPFDLARLFDVSRRALGAKKTLLLGLVDEESDLTYYRVRQSTPSGVLQARSLPEPAVGWLARDRVIVFDSAPVEELGKGLSYGSRVGTRLELSLIEAAYLRELGQLVLRDATTGRKIPPERFDRRARQLDRRFFERLAAYRLLRERRLVVKTGFKYGAHFRAYPRNPEHAHARYLVQAVPATHVASWSEVAGGVRVAQGVRKEFLVAGVAPDASVKFLALERIRP